jgi:thiol:disulfide interchange protein DsbA
VILRRLFLALALSAALTCCSQSGPPASAPHPAAAKPAKGPTAAAPVAPETPADAANIAQAASNQQEGADSGATAPDSSEAALERMAALPAAGQLPPGPWIAGTHYRVLSPAQPTDVPPGKVEIIEMFWYGCPHCYALDATVESWRRNKPVYVDFRRVPVTWNDEQRAQARLYYTLQALGKLDALHGKVFDEIHQKGDALYTAGDEKATRQAQAQFAKANDIGESDFLAAYDSAGVRNNVQQADDLIRREHIDSVPTFVVNGKYETDAAMAGSPEKLVRLLDDLAASEKHH